MTNFLLDPVNIAVLIVCFITVVLGLLVLVEQSRDKKNEHFFYFTIAATLWGLSMFLYRNAQSVEASIIFARVLYFAAATIPLSFIFFIKYFDSKTRFLKIEKIILSTISAFVSILSLSNIFILDVLKPSSGEKVIVFDPSLHLFYAAYITGFFLIGYVQLFKGIFREKDVIKKQYIAITIGTLVSSIVGVFTNLTLPLLGIFNLNWAGQVSVIVMTIFIFNSIVRLKLFNVKIIATEIITFSLWVFILIRTLISNSISDIIANSALLLVSLITGVLLIRTVKKEVEQREKIETLAKQLQDANEKLKGLDKLKTEFLSLASHQLRSPLTAIKGYASMLSEGAFGKLDEKKGEAVNRIYTSAQGLVNIVEDLLNISKIEQGGMKYEFMPTSLSSVVDTLFNEMKVPAESKHLDFSLDMDKHDKFIVSADPVKLKQVFLNLVDNSIKYTQKGFVKIALKRVEDKIVFSVSDSGMGISPETRSKLFEKFSRGEGGKTNTGGSGLGLYLAQQIAKAHKGDIVIESEGLGKGSVFTVAIPSSGKYPN